MHYQLCISKFYNSNFPFLDAIASLQLTSAVSQSPFCVFKVQPLIIFGCGSSPISPNVHNVDHESYLQIKS